MQTGYLGNSKIKVSNFCQNNSAFIDSESKALLNIILYANSFVFYLHLHI